MKNVYRTPEEKRKYSRCSIPEELRATEKHIDILRAGWKKFGIRIRAVSRITGIKQGRIYSIFRKEVFATTEEADLLDKAMVSIVLGTL